ncbi:MAG: alpha/beta hydrolase [bacterium]|nr:alpha/beta hydrolase [bacterium]
MKHKKTVTMLLRVLGGIVGALAVLVVVVLTALLYVETHDFRNWKGIDKTEFSCSRDDLTIRGTVFAPSGQENLPIAIVCHEFMANRLFSYPYAMALARSGYAAFCFDFCGGGIVCGSDGDSRDMSVLTEIEDLKAVIAFAKEQRYTNEKPLLLMGCSQGGLVAALTAAELQTEIGGLILQYPALSIPDAARKGEMLWMHFDPDNVPEEMRSGPMRLGRQYATDVMDIDTLPAITRYTGKVLIMHGDRDTLVDISGSQRAAEAYDAAGADVRFQIIPGGKHVFRSPKYIKPAANAISEFACAILSAYVP